MRNAWCVVCFTSFITRAERASECCSNACRIKNLAIKRLAARRKAEAEHTNVIVPPMAAQWLAVARHQEKFTFTVVDVDTFTKVSSTMWTLHKGRYARNEHIFLHHLVIGLPPDGLCVDHANSNTLDNRRENLRFVTHAQNMQNRRMNVSNVSGYKGVWPSGNRWCAEIRGLKLGSFESPEEAARAYDAAAKALFGVYARTNF
jgi:hypothetical protein